MIQKEENDIILGIVAGQSAAFKELYHLYYIALCRFAYKYIGDVVQSEDLVQDTLLKIWEQRAKLASITNLKSYLYTSVKNNCLNFLEHQKVVNKHAEIIVIEINSLSLQQDDADIEDEKQLIESKLVEAINDLPNQCREIFKMKYLEGLKTKEIAIQTNLSPRTVEAHVFNGLKTLRSKFKNIVPLLVFGLFIFSSRMFR